MVSEAPAMEFQASRMKERIQLASKETKGGEGG